MAICLTAAQAANLRWRGFRSSRLLPVPLSDGRYALSERTLSDPRFALYRTALAAGSVEADVGLTFVDDDTFRMTVDGKPVRLGAVDKDYAFGIPATNVYRFEIHTDDFGWEGDKANNNRRAELVSDGATYGAGETLWSAFSFVVGPQHIPFDPAGSVGGHNMIHQWHSVDIEVGRSPVLYIDMGSGNLTVQTRSDANAPTLTPVTHYSAARPADGQVHNVVISGLLGPTGHLNVWLNGTQIVNADTPIGYYNDDAGARDLAYPHWGQYQKNVDAPLVIFIANPEWGTASLSARSTTPLSVPDLEWL